MTPLSQVPGTAVSSAPTLGVPVIVGIGVSTRSPPPTAVVGALVLVTGS